MNGAFPLGSSPNGGAFFAGDSFVLDAPCAEIRVVGKKHMGATTAYPIDNTLFTGRDNLPTWDGTKFSHLAYTDETGAIIPGPSQVVYFDKTSNGNRIDFTLTLVDTMIPQWNGWHPDGKFWIIFDHGSVHYHSVPILPALETGGIFTFSIPFSFEGGQTNEMFPDATLEAAWDTNDDVVKLTAIFFDFGCRDQQQAHTRRWYLSDAQLVLGENGAIVYELATQEPTAAAVAISGQAGAATVAETPPFEPLIVPAAVVSVVAAVPTYRDSAWPVTAVVTLTGLVDRTPQRFDSVPIGEGTPWGWNQYIWWWTEPAFEGLPVYHSALDDLYSYTPIVALVGPGFNAACLIHPSGSVDEPNRLEATIVDFKGSKFAPASGQGPVGAEGTPEWILANTVRVEVRGHWGGEDCYWYASGLIGPEIRGQTNFLQIYFPLTVGQIVQHVGEVCGVNLPTDDTPVQLDSVLFSVGSINDDRYAAPDGTYIPRPFVLVDGLLTLARNPALPALPPEPEIPSAVAESLTAVVVAVKGGKAATRVTLTVATAELTIAPKVPRYRVAQVPTTRVVTVYSPLPLLVSQYPVPAAALDVLAVPPAVQVGPAGALARVVVGGLLPTLGGSAVEIALALSGMDPVLGRELVAAPGASARARGAVPCLTAGPPGLLASVLVEARVPAPPVLLMVPCAVVTVSAGAVAAAATGPLAPRAAVAIRARVPRVAVQLAAPGGAVAVAVAAPGVANVLQGRCAQVATWGLVPARLLALQAPRLDVSLSAAAGPVMAEVGPGVGVLAVGAPVPSLAILSMVDAGTIAVSAPLGAVAAIHAPQVASVALGAAGGSVALDLNAPRALVWVEGVAPWESAPTALAPVLVMNAVSGGLSEYALPWSGVVAHEGVVYGVTAAGLVRLQGTDDQGAPFASWIETGALALAPGARCNVPLVRLTLGADAAVQLVATPSCSGVARPVTYRVPALTSARARDRTVTLGRGPVGDDWTLRLGSGAGGGQWSLTGMTVTIDRVQHSR